ncbi:MAG: rRNA maturation RNase YbeY [Anaerolineales bacterium]|nr:rRNA maturation RNase YbeY [Anaerolineales bacterium]
MISVQIAEQILPLVPDKEVTAFLEQAARQVLLQTHADPEAEITILITGDEKLHELNQQYLGINAPTDVLSFPAGDPDPETGSIYLGDVVLSYPRALAQASAGGHSLEAELQLLVVHGVLHLLGYDHAEPEQKAAMWAVQSQALAELGCAITGPSE